MGDMNNGDQNDLNSQKQSAEEILNKAKQGVKKVGRFMFRHWKLTLILGLALIVMLIIFTAASYVIKIIDGTEDSESSSNVPSSASSYTSSLTVNEDGDLTLGSSIQELWDELIENGSRVDNYLDSAEELAKLINAELITQNVDTRKDPDEEIDWDAVIEEMTWESSGESEESNEEETDTNIQGIIKFKRVTSDDEDGTTMTYVDYDTFYGWIDDYEGGDTSILDDLLTHFTLKSETTVTSSNEEEENSDEDKTETKTYAIVATWNSTEYTEKNDDDETVSGESYSTYSISTTKVDYQNLTSGYTMPFNYLWEFLVITEDKDFVMELADLVYNSEIEISIYDSQVIVEETEEITYDKYKYLKTRGSVDIELADGTSTKCSKTAETERIDEGLVHTYTTITTTNTLNIEVTLADVWMAKYETDITSNGTSKNAYTSDGGSNEISLIDDIDYSKLEMENKENIRAQIEEEYSTWDQSTEIITWKNIEKKCEIQNIEQTITTTTKITNFTKSGVTVTEKTDKDSEETNFVTLFLEYKEARSAVLELWSWFMELMESNEDTVDLIDLTKYMVYKTTGKDYGVTEFDFEEFINLYGYSTSSTSSLYGSTTEEQVWWALIDAGYSQIATAAVMGNIWAESGFDLTAIESGSGAGLGLCQWTGGRREQLEAYIEYKGTTTSDIQTQIEFLIGELTPGGGAAGFASYQMKSSSSSKYDGNVYTVSDWKNASDIDIATTAFMAIFERPSYDPSVNHLSKRQEKALEYYNMFKDAERPTTDSRIGTISLSEPDATTMAEMLTLALQIADDDTYTYVWGAQHGVSYSSWSKSNIPTSFDCSSFVAWLYYTHFGISLPGTTGSYGSANLVTTNMNENNLEPGDILWKSGHVGMYIGNGQYVHAANAKTGIKVSSFNSSNFTRAYRYVE